MPLWLAAWMLVVMIVGAWADTPRTPLGGRCTIDMPDGDFSESERWAWRRLCSGLDVNLQDLDIGELPCRPDEIAGTVPEHRRLSERFVRFVLTDPRASRVMARSFVALACVDFGERLYIPHETVRPAVIISRSVLGSVDIGGANFERSLFLMDSYVNSYVQADYVTIGGGFHLRGTLIRGALRLKAASIAGDLDVRAAGVQSTFTAAGISIETDLLLSRGFFADIRLRGAEIGGGLWLDGVRLGGLLDLADARVEGTLMLSVPDSGPSEVRESAWGEEALVRLRNTSLGALQSRVSDWRRTDGSFVDTDLTGLTYRRLGAYDADRMVPGDGLSEAAAVDLIAWIEHSQPGHDRRFDPQPYMQLATVLDEAGATATADAVRYARLEHKRRADTTSTWEATRLWFSRWLIGHGVYPFNALVWFGALVVAGVFVARASRASVLSGWGQRFWFSLENALPLVEADEKHKGLDHEVAWVDTFFHLQKVLGFVLATILVAALTLLGG